MKPTRSIQCLFSAALLCFVPSQGVALAPPGLSIASYAGLSITGAVGRVYTVQYNTDLTQPNGWRGAGIVQLPSSPYLWVDTTAPFAGQRFYRAVEGPTNLVWLSPGTFTMGSPSNEVERLGAEGPQTVVTLTSGIFMGKYPVTQGEYLAVIGSNPSYFRNGTGGTNSGGTGNTITNESRHPDRAGAKRRTVACWMALPVADRGGVGVCVSRRNDNGVSLGCNSDDECQNFCGGVCLPPGDEISGDLGHCDNSHTHF